MRVTSRRLDVEGAFQYAQIIGLPPTPSVRARSAPAALYFFSAENTEAFQLYFKTMMLRVKDVLPGLSFAAGRMSYSSGEESASGIAAIDALTRLRLGSRMIGDFDWSIFERSFDGARLDVDRRVVGRKRLAAVPDARRLRGVGQSHDCRASRSGPPRVTAKPARAPRQELQLFAYHYRDQRDIRVRPDNTGLDASRRRRRHRHVRRVAGRCVRRRAAARSTPCSGPRPRPATGMGRSTARSASRREAGFRWSSALAPLAPRAACLHASGDGNRRGRQASRPSFQMLPTRAALLAVDRLRADEPPRRVRAGAAPAATRASRRASSCIALSLAEAADRWYAGSGATGRSGTYFGFSARASNGATSVGTIAEGSVDVTLKRRWSMNGYLGWIKEEKWCAACSPGTAWCSSMSRTRRLSAQCRSAVTLYVLLHGHRAAPSSLLKVCDLCLVARAWSAKSEQSIAVRRYRST